MLVAGKGRSRVHRLTRSLKRLGRNVGRRRLRSVAGQAVNDDRIRVHVLEILGRNVRKEMHRMSMISTPSYLRCSTSQDVVSFSWECLAHEIQEKAPTLYSFLHSATSVTIPPSKAKKTSRRTKQIPVIGICAAILLQHRCRSMNLVQCVLSILLYSGGASKQVRTNINLCEFNCYMYTILSYS